MRSSHSIRAGLSTAATLAMLAAPAHIGVSAQQPIPPPPLQEAGAFTFTTFLRGVPIGTELVALRRTADGGGHFPPDLPALAGRALVPPQRKGPQARSGPSGFTALVLACPLLRSM